ncbi:hypothetical protein ACOSQ3_021843 [Xanthoceras sorbifolium]
MPADPTKKPLQVVRKNCSRLLTREASMEHNDGGVSLSVSVPFRWESEPGTPKVRSRENPLPPLTPPPSYFYSNNNNNSSSSPKTPTTRSSKHYFSKSHILDTIFPKRTTKKTTKSRHPSSPVFSSSSSSSSDSNFSRSSFPWPVSSSSSSYSVPSSPARPSEFRRRYCGASSPRLSFDSRAVVDGDDDHLSSLCFGRGGTNPRFRGCYASMIKVLLN